MATEPGRDVPPAETEWQARLLTLLAPFAAAPMLFIGSGISRRYLGLEDWGRLLNKYADTLKISFDYLRSKAGGSYPLLASLLADEFFETWWKDPAFKASREKFAANMASRADPLKAEISQYLLKRVESPPAADQIDEINELKKVIVDGIITTNWDTFLEQCFPDYEVFIGQNRMLFSDVTGIGEIYKIHGCASAPTSLVLTKDDYDRFHRENPYLAAKLLAVFCEHPIFFLGYSLTDKNVIAILQSIVLCLDRDQVKRLNGRLFFVEWDSDKGSSPSITDSVIALGDGVTLPVKLIRSHSYAWIFKTLSRLKRRFPAKILRRLKRQVYDLVLTNDPEEQMHVAALDDDAVASDIEVVFGVGIIDKVGEMGYTGIRRDDLVEDVLERRQPLDAKRVLEETIPAIFRSNSLCPIFKYLSSVGRIKGGKIDLGGLNEKVKQLANVTDSTFWPPKQYRSHRPIVEKTYKSVNDIVKANAVEHAAYLVLLMPIDRVISKELLTFIKDSEKELCSSHNLHQSFWNKLVCLYDYVRWVRGA